MSADMGLRPGELVDITIRAARVQDASKSWPSSRDVVYLAGVWLDVTDAEEDVARIAPAEWPPVFGDMWRDATGDLWTMGRDVSGVDGETWSRFLCLDQSVSGVWEEQAVLADRGPMTLVHREPVHQDGELVAATTAEGGEPE